jgi:L,D-transpeptidase catalytic domain
MDGHSPRYFAAALLFMCASLAWPAGDAAAQGFSSISSAPPAATSAPVPAAPTPAPATATAVGATGPASPDAPAPIPGPPTTVAGAVPLAPGAPAAQLAALGPTSPSSGGTPSLGGAGPDLSAAMPSSRGAFDQADKVLVDKSERRLYLLKHGRVVGEYPVKLGLNPYGHKQQEGDFRTPEGKYTLTRRNPRSEFFLAIQVSYPNQEDTAWAKENGRKPGGLIMIHGQPNVPKRPMDFYASRDWTDGCIALSNADMVDVWLRTTAGVPIEIRP